MPNAFHEALFLKRRSAIKMMRIMNITAILLLVCCLQVSARVNSQGVTLYVKNAPLQKVFQEIKKQTGYTFMYTETILKEANKVSMEVKNSSLQETLSICFASQPFTYKIINKTIVVQPKEKTLQNISNFIEVPQLIVTGEVTDKATGKPLAGVTIQVKGSNSGTSSDTNGNYSINVPEKATLVVSSVGYDNVEIPVNGRTVIDISLKVSTTGLNEVVVVGYGTQKKKDLTGSVATLGAGDLKDRAVVNFGEAMAGQLAGVQVQQFNGAPGGGGLSIRIRGTGSITQSNSPLYVVDGYPMEEGAFSLINPTDIESIQVLKDASSTAIYGSRGANGVVIVTTKKGKLDKSPTISFNAFFGYQERTKIIPELNRDQYVQWFMDGRNQAWLDEPVIDDDPDKSPHTSDDPNSRRQLYPSANTLYIIPDGKSGYEYNFRDPQSVAQMPDNNWQNLLFRKAKIEQYELSVTGGSKKTMYALSGSYMNQDGIVLGTNYQRFNFKTNIESELSNRIKVGMNLNAYYAKGREQVNGKYSPIQFALQLPPIFPVHNPDGTYGSMTRNPEIFAGDVSNPIGVAELVQTNRLRYGWIGTLFAEWEPIDNLKYRININGGIQDNNLEDYEPSNVDLDASRAPRPARAFNERTTDYDWLIEQTLTYDKTFAEKHHMTLLGGFSTQKHNTDYMYGEARGFATDQIHTLNAGNLYQLTSTKSDYSLISYFGRVNYSFDNRYLLTATLRTDGSSRFGTNNKWGVFPSAAAAWRISQEDFMKNLTGTINNLKLRVSYGVVGNNRIGNYSSIGLLNAGFYPTGDALQNTVDPSTISNDNLGWEKVLQSDVGLDVGLFNSRVTLEADYYHSKSINLLLNVQVPTITGYSTQIQNIGKVLNKGMEFLLTTQNLIGKFKWSSNFNIAFNKNEVLELGPNNQPLLSSAPNANNAFITKVGYPMASFYGYEYDGVFMNQHELDKYPHRSVVKAGDGRYIDVNGDGIIDQTDKTILGNNQPKFTGGFSNNFSYKNFTLSAQLSFSYGGHLFSIFKRMIAAYHGDRNGIAEMTHRWRSTDQPGNGMIFRATRAPVNWQLEPSSYWLTDGSYLRLRNITLSYDFDQIKLKSMHLRLYTTGTNLFTWTKYPGYDPETSSEGDGLTMGGDYTGYPAARSIIVGLNLTF